MRFSHVVNAIPLAGSIVARPYEPRQSLAFAARAYRDILDTQA